MRIGTAVVIISKNIEREKRKRPRVKIIMIERQGRGTPIDPTIVGWTY